MRERERGDERKKEEMRERKRGDERKRDYKFPFILKHDRDLNRVPFRTNIIARDIKTDSKILVAV